MMTSSSHHSVRVPQKLNLDLTSFAFEGCADSPRVHLYRERRLLTGKRANVLPVYFHAEHFDGNWCSGG